jgi:hypothetical protein
MYIDPEINVEQAYRPETPKEWAEQALLQAHTTSAESIAKMELLRGVEFRRGRVEISLFIHQNCEAALAYSRGQSNGKVPKAASPAKKAVVPSPNALWSKAI